ncbi:apicomplexa specific secreted protein [Cryptosporidium ryanae]|uniref:apicomplexa specific secreted protein n=1 Tax=Cryptosporidium ryanae TaxID=515981 RepID=UPI00351A7EDD|nr:apicomplexa specific secreted protein [Cryptosporidium ryanae]
MSSSKVKTIAAITGGFAVVGALLYFLFREDKSEEENKGEEPREVGKNGICNKGIFGNSVLVKGSEEVEILGALKEEGEDGGGVGVIENNHGLVAESINKSLENYTKEDMLQILDEILESQDHLRSVMRILTKEFIDKPPASFQECYKKVRSASPQDPLDKRKISLSDFDRLVERFYTDDKVSSTIEKIMGLNGSVSSGNGVASCNNDVRILEKVENISNKQLININEFMLTELKEFVGQYSSVSDKHIYDVKTLTIAAQVWVGSKVEKQFNLNSDEIETAMLIRSQSLKDDPDFGRISFQMQATMEQLIGSPAPSNLPFSI